MAPIRETAQQGQEPPPPPTLPEMDEVDGLTGAINIRAEGEDRAKHADDDPERSATH